MPNIATALKAEISRVARKEIRAETEALKKAASAARSEIAALKKEVRELSRALKVAQRQAAKAAPAPTTPKGEQEGGKAIRFSATRLAAQRERLGLSVANMAKLIGVSSVTLYKWESGQARPRRAQLEAIARVRGLGKREALLELSRT